MKGCPSMAKAEPVGEELWPSYQPGPQHWVGSDSLFPLTRDTSVLLAQRNWDLVCGHVMNVCGRTEVLEQKTLDKCYIPPVNSNFRNTWFCVYPIKLVCNTILGDFITSAEATWSNGRMGSALSKVSEYIFSRTVFKPKEFCDIMTTYS